MWHWYDSMFYGLGVGVLSLTIVALLVLLANFIQSTYDDHVVKFLDTQWKLRRAEEELEETKIRLLEAKTKLEAVSPVTDGGYRERIDVG